MDEYVTEAVLAKLEQRQAVTPESEPWPGAPELERAQQKLSMLTRQWQEDRISDGLYFANVEKLEARIRELTNERNRHAVIVQRAVADVANVRRRWFTPAEDGGLDLSEKRAYLREALYAVIVSPAGKGTGSHGKFNPDLLELVWRIDPSGRQRGCLRAAVHVKRAGVMTGSDASVAVLRCCTCGTEHFGVNVVGQGRAGGLTTVACRLPRGSCWVLLVCVIV